MERLELRWVRPDGQEAIALKWFYRTPLEASTVMDRIADLVKPDTREEASDGR